MKLQNPFAFPILLITLIAPSFSLPVTVEKKTVTLDEVERTILCEVFSPDFPNGDCNYHNLIAASDGFLYFTLGTHAPGYATRFYRFDPKTEEMSLVAEVDKAIGEDAEKVISEGKIHTRFFEDDGKLWFASHTSFYEGGLPGLDYGGKKPHQGGRFMSYDLGSGEFQSLANVLPSEGIISMTLDREHDILYGITWPSGLLMSYSIPNDDLRTWGAVQNRGEWGHHPWDWDRICRTLAIDPEGLCVRLDHGWRDLEIRSRQRIGGSAPSRVSISPRSSSRNPPKRPPGAISKTTGERWNGTRKQKPFGGSFSKPPRSSNSIPPKTT